MIKKKELEQHCEKMLLNYSIEGDVLIVGGNKYEIIDSEQVLFNEDFDFLPYYDNGDINKFVYQFCGHWYIQEDGEETTMTPLKYIGEVKQRVQTNHFLGIHSGNELLNGVGLYSDWIKKAKFLGIKTLGICEKNNIGGSLDFQKQCIKNGVKPVIGISIDIKRGKDIYSIKCYSKNFIGWQNLLKFTYKLNVENEPNIDESFLIENMDGISVIIDPKSCQNIGFSNITNLYQLDTVIFEEENKDIQYVGNLKSFILSDMKPISIFDAYYIEKDDYKVREKLWGIAKSYDFRSKNQYFKNNDAFATELMQMFVKGNTSWIKLFKEAESNLNDLVESSNFVYDTTSRHLPKYEMTDEESKNFSSNDQLFMHLIKEGFKDRGIKKEVQQKYVNRLKSEIDVLRKGDVIDYFLITRDILNFAKSKDILIGIGRGSAGGSLVSYLLGIIQINPIEFDLIFERFLNEGRMGALTECKGYLIGTSDGNIKLNEKSILKVLRNGIEINTFVEELQINDIIKKY